MTEETFDRLMRVLLKGPYFLTQKLLPLMADGGGDRQHQQQFDDDRRSSPATRPTRR